MDFTALLAWLDWQSDRHPSATAMVALLVVQRDCTGEEAYWWAEHPARANALIAEAWRSGLVRDSQTGASFDYDIRDLRNAVNVDFGRTISEVKWTLNRLRDRRWGVIP